MVTGYAIAIIFFNSMTFTIKDRWQNLLHLSPHHLRSFDVLTTLHQDVVDPLPCKSSWLSFTFHHVQNHSVVWHSIDAAEQPCCLTATKCTRWTHHELRGDPFVISDEKRVQSTKTVKQLLCVRRRRTVDGVEELLWALTSVRLRHERPVSARWTTLIDRPHERRATSRWRQLVKTDTRRARTLAKYRDAVRISSEWRDVVLDPAKCQLLIFQTEVPCKIKLNVVHSTSNTQVNVLWYWRHDTVIARD